MGVFPACIIRLSGIGQVEFGNGKCLFSGNDLKCKNVNSAAIPSGCDPPPNPLFRGSALSATLSWAAQRLESTPLSQGCHRARESAAPSTRSVLSKPELLCHCHILLNDCPVLIRERTSFSFSTLVTATRSPHLIPALLNPPT